MVVLTMNWADMVFLMTAGVAAGALNTLVAGGSLVSFPALMLLGFPPVWANVINSLGLLPGGFSGVYGYRAHLPKQPALLVKIAVLAVTGALMGSALLLSLPARYFTAAAPVLILAASVLVAVQPLLVRHARQTGSSVPEPVACSAVAAGEATDSNENSNGGCVTLTKSRPTVQHGNLGPWTLILAASVYGGYWVVALGVVMFAVFNAAFPHMSLQQINALKTLTATIINGTAVLVFSATGHLLPVWEPVVLLGGGALVGGWLGAVLGRRLRPSFLRTLVMITGLCSAAWLVT